MERSARKIRLLVVIGMLAFGAWMIYDIGSTDGIQSAARASYDCMEDPAVALEDCLGN
jgi:hypothetical protein